MRSVGQGIEAVTPTITVSLVTFNGMTWLPECLASVRKQTMPAFELLAIDNASGDGSLELLRHSAAAEPRMTVRESRHNLGFAVAHNRNIAAARGEFVMLLNQDMVLDRNFLSAALKVLDSRNLVAAVQGRIRRLGSGGARTATIDSTGLVMHRDRRVVARRQGERESYSDLVPGPVWGVDGPAPVYRRSALAAVREPRSGGGWEVLDEDFFMYKEDVDLAWRLRRMGWTAWYEPQALAWHARGTGGRPDRTVLDLVRADRTIPRWIKAMSWRNHKLMQIKNERAADFVASLPWILRREVLSLGFMTVFDPRRLAMISHLVSAIPGALDKRRTIADGIGRIEAERT